MLTEAQLDMVEKAARNSFPLDERGQILLTALLELIDEVRQRRRLEADGQEDSGHA